VGGGYWSLEGPFIEASVVLALIAETKGDEEEKTRRVSQVHKYGSHKVLGLFKGENAAVYQALLSGQPMAQEVRYINTLIASHRERIVSILSKQTTVPDKVLPRTQREIDAAVKAAETRRADDEASKDSFFGL
jgi:hypothetical protein